MLRFKIFSWVLIRIIFVSILTVFYGVATLVAGVSYLFYLLLTTPVNQGLKSYGFIRVHKDVSDAIVSMYKFMD